jgi:hypothetical protein
MHLVCSKCGESITNQEENDLIYSKLCIACSPITTRVDFYEYPLRTPRDWPQGDMQDFPKDNVPDFPTSKEAIGWGLE